jgi:zinc protease
LRRSVYPAPNPLGKQLIGEMDSVSSLTAADVRRFHADTYSSNGATIAIVGGMSGFDRAVEVLERVIGVWTPKGEPPSRPELGIVNDSGMHIEDTISGKTQSDVAAGIATISRLHADYYALDLANLILGRLGLMGRLGAEVRDHQGLAYYIFSQLDPRLDGSLWSVRAGVAPDAVERAIDAISREVTRLQTESITDEELRNAKSYLIGILPLALESHDGVANLLLAIEEFRLGLDFLERYPAIIQLLTQDEVQQAATKHIRLDRLVIAVARPA